MPILPENKHRYLDPKKWAKIRGDILKEAGYRCEGSPDYPDCRAEMYTLHPVTESRVVLTIAHLDHMPEHNDRFNLRAWCQRCHLNYDKAHHAETRRKRKHADQLELF